MDCQASWCSAVHERCCRPHNRVWPIVIVSPKCPKWYGTPLPLTWKKQVASTGPLPTDLFTKPSKPAKTCCCIVISFSHHCLLAYSLHTADQVFLLRHCVVAYSQPCVPAGAQHGPRHPAAGRGAGAPHGPDPPRPCHPPHHALHCRGHPSPLTPHPSPLACCASTRTHSLLCVSHLHPGGLHMSFQLALNKCHLTDIAYTILFNKCCPTNLDCCASVQ